MVKIVMMHDLECPKCDGYTIINIFSILRWSYKHIKCDVCGYKVGMLYENSNDA